MSQDSSHKYLAEARDGITISDGLKGLEFGGCPGRGPTCRQSELPNLAEGDGVIALVGNSLTKPVD
jgi:hypothetical protein